MRLQNCVFKTTVQLCQWRQLRSIAQVREKVANESHHGTRYNEARPYSEIPRMSMYAMVRGYMPGGKYKDKTVTESLEISRETYGDTFLIAGFLGRKDMMMSFNPEDIPTVLRSEGIWPYRRGLETSNYYRTVHRKEQYGGVTGLLATNDEAWGKVRSTLNPVLMQPRSVKLYLNKMQEVNDEFLQRIREIRDPNTMEVPDSFENEINRLTFESVAVVAINQTLGLIRRNRNDEEANKIFQSLRDFFDLVVALDFGPPIWKYIKTKKFQKMMDTLDTIYAFSLKYVDQALERIENDKTPRKDGEEQSILEKLLKIDKQLAKVMAMDLLIAGVDTTSSTLAGILLCIAKNPEKQQKLRDEIRTILPNKDSLLTMDNMKNLPYLRACIKEGFRMYPIGVGTIRSNKEDIVMSGYQVPKGTEIVLAHNYLLNMEKYCPKAKEYIPERWLRSDEAEHAPVYSYLYMPLGHGPRSCVGKRIVDAELEITVARLVRNFYIEFNYSTENAFKNRLVNVPAIPLKFKFTEVEN